MTLAAATAPLGFTNPASAGSTTPTTVRVSVSSTGAQANGRSVVDAISPDGRFVLFDSWATNLVAGDTNGVVDVFVRDRNLGRTIRVSVGPEGRQANGPSGGAAISSDGRFVLFASEATDLTNQHDRNRSVDVFVRNVRSGRTFRESVKPGGGQFFDNRYGGVVAAGISDNGRWVAFGENVPYQPSGCCVARRTFVRDRARHVTREIPRPAYTDMLPEALSPDGRWLTTSLWMPFHFVVQGYTVRDLRTGRTTTVDTYLANTVAATPDAHFLIFDEYNGDTSGTDLLRWNRFTGRERRLLAGRPWTSLSAVGISAHGRYAFFISSDAKLVPADTNHADDLFRLDAQTGRVVRVDRTSTGAEIVRGVVGGAYDGVNGVGMRAAVSSDGRWVAFTSRGGLIVPDDTNHAADVFVRGPLPTPPGS